MGTYIHPLRFYHSKHGRQTRSEMGRKKSICLLFVTLWVASMALPRDVSSELRKMKEQIATLQSEVKILKADAVKLESNKKLKQSLLPGGYGEFSVQDLQWQSLHMAAAAACRASTVNGGSGSYPNKVFA